MDSATSGLSVWLEATLVLKEAIFTDFNEVKLLSEQVEEPRTGVP